MKKLSIGGKKQQIKEIQRLNLGVALKNGKGVKKSYKKAAFWLIKAAEQGNTDAQNNLGISYYDGQGVKQSYEKAAYWFTKAA